VTLELGARLIRTKAPHGLDGDQGRLLRQRPDSVVLGPMQIELLNRNKWRTKIELSIAIAEWIEHFSVT
jgi:hypothetical protein